MFKVIHDYVAAQTFDTSLCFVFSVESCVPFAAEAAAGQIYDRPLSPNHILPKVSSHRVLPLQGESL